METDKEDALRHRLEQAAEVLRNQGYIEQPDGTWKTPRRRKVRPDQLKEGQTLICPHHGWPEHIFSVQSTTNAVDPASWLSWGDRWIRTDDEHGGHDLRLSRKDRIEVIDYA